METDIRMFDEKRKHERMTGLDRVLFTIRSNGEHVHTQRTSATIELDALRAEFIVAGVSREENARYRTNVTSARCGDLRSQSESSAMWNNGACDGKWFCPEKPILWRSK